MKKILAAVMAVLICFSFAACGADGSSNSPDSSLSVRSSQKLSRGTPKVQDFIAFLDGIKPYYDKNLEMEDGSVFRCMNYTMPLGHEERVEQYIGCLISGGYDLILNDIYTNEQDAVTYKYYYLKYIGDNTGCFEKMSSDYHINIAVCTYKYEGVAEINFGYADGFDYVDNEFRVDFSKISVKEAIATPTPQPVVTPTPEPATIPETQPGSTSVVHPAAPSNETVDKNAALIPEFSSFLGRNPSEEKDRYYGGTRKYYQKLPLETQQAVVSEVLGLLGRERYQLELIEKVEVSTRIEYNFRYTGNVGMDSIHSKNDDTRYYNLQFTVYNRNNDDGNYGIHFHYSPQFVEENCGYSVSAGLSGGSNGGGDIEIEGFEPYVPDAAKLDCLTCDGDGDCTRCGGSTYEYFGDTRTKCTKCKGSGRCRTCGGTGNRN